MYPAVPVEEAAASGIEGLVIFHDDDGLFDGVKRRAATFEHTPAGGQRIIYAAHVGVDHVVGHGPGATMNHQDGIVGQDIPRSRIRDRACPEISGGESRTSAATG